MYCFSLTIIEIFPTLHTIPSNFTNIKKSIFKSSLYLYKLFYFILFYFLQDYFLFQSLLIKFFLEI